MHYLSSVYFVNQPLHVSGIFVAHHQEVHNIYIYIYIYNWYVLCFSVDCLWAGLRWIYRVSQEECARLRESVPYVKYTDITQNTYIQS